MSSPHPYFGSPAPLIFTLPECQDRFVPPALVVRGLAGAFMVLHK